MADDLGYGDVGCYGASHIDAPNIDRLAGEGMAFTDAYANSNVCSPTRLALMTGRYHYRYRAGLDEPLSIISELGLEAGIPTLPGNLRNQARNEQQKPIFSKSAFHRPPLVVAD